MVPFWLDLLVTALAVAALVDVWLSGRIFAGWRAWAEAWADEIGWRSRLGELLTCPFCLTYQAALWSATYMLLARCLAPDWELLRLPLYVLAVARVGRLWGGLRQTYASPDDPHDHPELRPAPGTAASDT